MTGWRGLPGPYDTVYFSFHEYAGGGLLTSYLRPGQRAALDPSARTGGGGGLRQSTAEPLTGYGGVGGPGPGALIGVNGG